jgi:hypothetical protein
MAWRSERATLLFRAEVSVAALIRSRGKFGVDAISMSENDGRSKKIRDDLR